MRVCMYVSLKNLFRSVCPYAYTCTLALEFTDACTLFERACV